jgi:hypothetical protein
MEYDFNNWGRKLKEELGYGDLVYKMSRNHHLPGCLDIERLRKRILFEIYYYG